MELVLATQNRKKAIELVDHLAGLPIVLRSLADFPDVTPAIEDGETFLENARKKAEQVARQVGRWTLGEDSGLCVDALQGRPGVYSARFAGEHATDEANNDRLLHELHDVPRDRRTAHYVCTAVLADPNGQTRSYVEGRCSGRIELERHGTLGFGYDPLFTIVEYHKTFAELGLLVKRHLSHRARAVSQLRVILQKLIAEQR